MPKMILSGKVVSDINDKTVVVKVITSMSHPIYSKRVTVSKKYHAHDENNFCKIGDIVSIRECCPISRKKKWEVI